MKLLYVTPSHKLNKKYMAIFMIDDNLKITHFGDDRYEDFTMHRDTKRKQRYINRHQHENWDNPTSAGTLSRFLLWNKSTLIESIKDFKKRFNL